MVAETQLIHKDMVIRDLVENYPDAALVLQDHGLQCLGCHVNVMETIAQGARIHGMQDDQIEKMVQQANQVAKEGPKARKAAVDPSTMDIVFSDKAIAKVKEFREKAEDAGEYFRVGVKPGGCSGMSYFMTFEKEKGENDIELDKGGLKVITDKGSMDMLGGVHVDFVETLNESGFKIENPNAKRTCGCGSSFR